MRSIVLLKKKTWNLGEKRDKKFAKNEKKKKRKKKEKKKVGVVSSFSTCGPKASPYADSPPTCLPSQLPKKKKKKKEKKDSENENI